MTDASKPNTQSYNRLQVVPPTTTQPTMSAKPEPVAAPATKS